MKMGEKAVSEVIGAILLLAMAVAVFSVVYINVLSDDGPSPNAFLTVIGKIDDKGDVVFDHSLGEELFLDSNVIIEIAGGKDLGGRTIYTNVSNLLLYNYDYIIDNNRWNIGERLIYHPEEPLTGSKIKEPVDIKAYIIDKLSNSMVFWGTLQEGYIGDKGGIWHFDEAFWNMTPDEVKDSSGHGNHGKALSEGTNTTGDPAISGRAGYFDGLTGSAVEIKSSYSLNIKDNITVEAWVRPLNEVGELDYSKLGPKFGFYPNIIHVGKDVYAIVSETQNQVGILQTVRISHFNGTIADTGYAEEFGEGPEQGALRANITYVANNIYAIAFINEQGNGVLRTVKIFSNGTIRLIDDPFSSLTFDNSKFCYEPNIIHVSGNIFAIAYRIKKGNNNSGFIKIVNIYDNGVISDKDLPLKLPFEEVLSCYEPNIIHVSDQTFVITYNSNENNIQNSNVYLKLINISSDGSEIYISSSSVYELDTQCWNPRIINVCGDTYAIVYSGFDGNTSQGILKLVNIYPLSGLISDEGLPVKFPFDSINYTSEPDITYGYDDFFVIAYSKGKNNKIGSVRMVEINLTTSTIYTDLSLSYEYYPHNPANIFKSPDIIKITDAIYAIVYTSQTHEGELVSIRLSRDYTNPYERGIFKAGSVQIFARTWDPDIPDMGKIYASVTDSNNIRHELNYSIPNYEVWYHVVLTYNESTSKITLYINGSPIIPCLYFSGEIDISSSDILVGHKFFGYIDELAIFDYALTPIEVMTHYTDPELLHTYDKI